MIQLIYRCRFLFALVGLFGLLSFAPSPAGMPLGKRKLLADKKISSMTYSMRHPMHSWEGVSREVNAALVYNDETKKAETVAVVVKVASFDSRNSNRDSHAMESLEGIKYPTVTFVGQQIDDDGAGKLTVTGNLTFHGVTRPITLPVTRRINGNRLQYEGSFDLKLTDFNIEKPTLMLVPVDDELNMKFLLAFIL